MSFKKYMHLERFGTSEVENIEIGKCYVFPKIDGTNASVWLAEGNLQAGSRTRLLSVENDNAGFYNEYVLGKHLLTLDNFFKSFPNLRLYGEWLVPHSLKTYRQSCWRNFYVFDVYNDIEERYLSFDEYEHLLKEYGIEYIPPLAIVTNCTYDRLVEYLGKNDYLIEDGKGSGEGVVLKNYNFVNKFGRVTWAKMVTSEFKEKHRKEMGASVYEQKLIEQDIVDEFVTSALVEKVYAKINNEAGFTSREIPRLLNTVFYDLVKEDSWEYVKKHNFPTINFKTLKAITFSKVKELKTEIFK